MNKRYRAGLAALLALTLLAAGCSEVDESESLSTKSTAPMPAVTTAAPTITTRPPDTTVAETAVPTLATVGNDLTREQIEALESTMVTWGPGKAVDGDNRPTAPVSLQEQYGKYDAVFIGEPNGKIYLTFDEGYENGYTPKILDVLKEKNVKAVFFITGAYAKSQGDLIRRMIDEGHVLASHSMTHPGGTKPKLPELSYDQIVNEIVELHDYVLEHYDYTMTLFRPPEGVFSERSLAIAQKLGYKSVFWSFAYADWNPDQQPDRAEALAKVTGASHDGGVFLLHAVSKTNTEILPEVIDHFRSKGLSVEPLQ